MGWGLSVEFMGGFAACVIVRIVAQRGKQARQRVFARFAVGRYVSLIDAVTICLADIEGINVQDWGFPR